MMSDKLFHVLIVDDDEFVGEIISAGFENDLMIRIDNCKTAEEFWISVALRVPHCIILDLFLQDSNGIDLLKRIKMTNEIKSIPVIVMSGTDDIKMRRESLDAGAIHFVMKPFTIVELRRLILEATAKTAR